jgi:hypothetical protein
MDEAPKKPKKARKINPVIEIKAGLNRIKDLSVLRDAIDRWNKSPEGKKLEKSRGQPLRTTDNKKKLIEKIMAYDMYKTINIDIPPKPEKKVKQTSDEVKAKAKAKREANKIKGPIRKKINDMYIKYLRRKGKEDKSDLISELNEEWETIEEENEEFFEENEEFYDELDSFIEDLKKKIKSNDKPMTLKELTEELRKRKELVPTKLNK